MRDIIEGHKSLERSYKRLYILVLPHLGQDNLVSRRCRCRVGFCRSPLYQGLQDAHLLCHSLLLLATFSLAPRPFLRQLVIPSASVFQEQLQEFSHPSVAAASRVARLRGPGLTITRGHIGRVFSPVRRPRSRRHPLSVGPAAVVGRRSHRCHQM